MRRIILYTQNHIRYYKRMEYVADIEPETSTVKIINLNTAEEEKYQYSHINFTGTTIEIWTDKAGLSPAMEK